MWMLMRDFNVWAALRCIMQRFCIQGISFYYIQFIIKIYAIIYIIKICL